MRAPAVVIAFGVLAACRGGTDVPRPAAIEAVAATAQQSGPAGAPLASPLAAIVRADDGAAVVRAGVRWLVTSGDGASLSDSVTQSDGNGRAEVALTLGTALGGYEVTATLVDVPDQTVTFSATATAPPALSGVMPTSFTAGDTVTLTGDGLTGGRVEIGGQTARVLTASATSMTVVAPVCLAPGPVQVRVRVGRAVSNGVAATYVAAASPIQLAVGEYVSIDPTLLAGCATFAAAGPQGAQYLVAPQSVAGAPGTLTDYRLAGDTVTVTFTAPPRVVRPLTHAERFHDALRAQEREAARRPRPAAPPAGAQLRQRSPVEVGDRRTFQVCERIPCGAAADFSAVTAEARYAGQHAALFLDVDAPAGFTDADFESLGRTFDETLYDVDTRAFGAESDVDANGVVIILFSPVVNMLTSEAQCETSIITGYFFGIDIDALFFGDPRSNQGEVFYAISPDASGTVTCALSTATVRRLVPVTFTHEFQHMISYNQHVLQRSGSSEVLWLNEALSHVAEELVGRRFEAQGDETRFSQFVIGNLFNANLFLENSGAFFTLPRDGTGSLEERGGGWLFLRWLIDRYGDDVTRRLVETRRTGAENVEAVTGEPIDRLLAQWFLANYVSDLAGLTAPAELTFTSWRFRTTYGSLNQQLPDRFMRPFPIEPVAFSGPGFAANGTLRSGSGDYFVVDQAANDDAFTLRLTTPGGQPLGGVTVPRLNVMRIQ